MTDMMDEYYEKQDSNDLRKIDEKVKQLFNEHKDKKTDKWEDLVKNIGGGSAEGEQFEEAAKTALSEELLAEQSAMKAARFPSVIVPGAVKPVGVTDKEGNSVYRIIVYASQADDVVKCLRK